jgi:hypothetical protein
MAVHAMATMRLRDVGQTMGGFEPESLCDLHLVRVLLGGHATRRCG